MNEKINYNVPEGFLIKCPKCEKLLVNKLLKGNNTVCYECNTYLKESAHDIITRIVDENSFREKFVTTKIYDPLDHPGYPQKIEKLREQLLVDEAVTVGTAKVGGYKTAIGVMDNSFIMGSMGTAVGRKITMLFEYATKRKYPVILFTTSGGARMQEGIISLMQMVKITNALKMHHNAGLFYMPILMNPTSGGVTASFAQLGDVIVAEDNALICFAGPRVIQKTIKQELPPGFQRAEFLMETGFIDKIVTRFEQKDFIITMLKYHSEDKK